MRRSWTLFLMFMLFAGCQSAVFNEPAAAQAKDDANQPEDEPEALELQGKVTPTLDAGGHTANIDKALFTPDGKHLLTGSSDHSIRIWDVKTGQCLRVLRPPGTSEPRYYALSPDGQTLAVASPYWIGKNKTNVIFLMALADGRIKAVLKGHTDRISAVAFAPGGKRLASGGEDKTIRIWNVAGATPPQVLQVDSPAVMGIAFSKVGNRLAHAVRDSDTCNIWDLSTEKIVAKLKGGKFSSGGFQDPVAWSPDGKTVATSAENGVLLWEPNGKLRKQLLGKGRTQSVAFSADSSRVLVTWRGLAHRASVFNVASGKEELVFTPKGPAADAKVVKNGAFSPDGKLAATTGRGDGTHEIFIWKTTDGTVVRRLAAASPLSATNSEAGWNADGKIVSWTKVDKPASWKGGPTNFHVGELQFGPISASSKVRGAILQQGALSLKMVDTHTAQVLKNGKSIFDLKLGEAQHMRYMTLVGRDRAVLSTSGHYSFLFDTNTGMQIRVLVQQGVASSVAPSPDGRYLLSLSKDQTLRIWEVERGNLLLSLCVNGQDWVIWTPKGYYAATPGGERLMGWTVDNGIDKETNYYPAERFRKVLYRPDVIKLVLEKGSVTEALTAANAALKKEGKIVREGVADLEKLLPPQPSLQILDKKDLPKLRLKASAVAAVTDQPVTELRLLIDGRKLPDSAGLSEFAMGQQKAEVEWTITLPPGKHILSVLARSSAAESSSQPIEVTFDNPVEQPVMHVLPIGVDNYQNPAIAKLKFAAADARALAAALKSSCAGPGRLFREAPGDPLIDKQATRKGVLDALAAIGKKVKANDLVVVFFAGHGKKDPKDDRFHLLTVDADLNDLANTALSGEDLHKNLGDIHCQVLLLLDACHSAAGVKAFRPVTDDLTRILIDDRCGVAVLSAAMGHEPALEREDHGLFTKALLAGLIDTQDVPFDRSDRRQYIHHLYSFVLDEVKRLSEDRQHPSYGVPWTMPPFAIRQLPDK